MHEEQKVFLIRGIFFSLQEISFRRKRHLRRHSFRPALPRKNWMSFLPKIAFFTRLAELTRESQRQK